MSNDPKQPDPKTFPVKSFRFVHAMSLPGAVGRNDLQCGNTQENTQRWIAEYLPALRHFRIAYYEPSSKTPVVRMVPEGSVKDWEPA